MKNQARSTLLSLVGLSPAVVTETLYALELERPPTQVNRLVLITTEGTRARAIGDLFGSRGGITLLRRRFARMHTDLSLDACSVEVLKDEIGQPLADILTPGQSQCIADQLLAIVEGLCCDGLQPLIGSIAGGRKTMSAYLTLAFCLRARPGDRLTHVLVDGPGEPDSRRFLPTVAQDRAYVEDAKTCPIRLVNVPFPSLRRQVSGIYPEPRTFSGLVDAQRRDEDLRREPPRLVFNLETEEIRIGDRTVHLGPREAHVYRQFVEAKRGCACEHPGHGCPDNRCFIAFGPAAGDRIELIRCLMSRLKGKLNRALGSKEAARIYSPELLRGPQPRYGFRLNRRNVKIVP